MMTIERKQRIFAQIEREYRRRYYRPPEDNGYLKSVFFNPADEL